MVPAVDSPDPDGLSPADDEQDLLVVLRLSNRQMGTRDEREQLEQLADQLEAAVVAAGAGEYDGDEFGGGTCTLFFCGPDVDALIRVLRPLLRHSPLARGGHFVRAVADAAGTVQQERVPV